MDERLELVIGNLRNDNRADGCTEMLLQRIENGIEILVRIVDLGDDEEDMLAKLLCGLECLDRTDMDAGLCGYADDNGIACIEAFVGCGCKINQTGDIQQIDLEIAVFKTREREID